MKILHTEASLGYGGQEVRIVKEASGMQQLGHEVTLVCPQEAQIGQLARDHGIRVVILPIGKKKLSAVFTLRKWLQNNPHDVINTHSSTDSWLTALATLMMKQRPAIVRTRHISAPVSDSFTSRWLYTRSCDHLVTTGENLRQTLINQNNFPADHITSVPTGIDLDYFTPGNKQLARSRLSLDQESFIVGIVATLRSWKGHRYLIEAFSRFSDSNSLLLVVGDGPQWNALHELARELGVQERVMFTGRQDNVAEWMQAMDIFCLPSYANEGVPQALMQSQSCGIPAITTLNGSINEAVIPGETAIIVTPQDSASLLDALEQVRADTDTLAEMSGKAVDNARKHFSSERMLESMTNIFTTATRHRNG